MNRMTSIGRFLFGLAVVVCLIECSSDEHEQVAGGTDMPDETIAGVLINPEGAPIPEVRVNLYREREGTPFRVEIVAADLTDNAGRYAFTRLTSGEYKTGAFTADSSLVHFRTGIDIAESGVPHEIVDTMKSPARLTGRFALPSAERTTGELLVPGSPFACPLGQEGTFALSIPPLQRFHIVLIAGDRAGGMAMLSRETLMMEVDDSLHIDSLGRIPFLSGVSPVVLDNFEDGNRTHVNGASWYHYSDSSSGGGSTVRSYTEHLSGANSSASCAYIEVEFGNKTKNGKPFSGFASNLGWYDKLPAPAYDFSKLRSISFELRGTPHEVEVRLYSELYDESISVLQINSQPVDWTRFTIEIEAMHSNLPVLQQQRWNRIRMAVSKIDFRIIGGENRPKAGNMSLDDIGLKFH